MVLASVMMTVKKAATMVTTWVEAMQRLRQWNQIALWESSLKGGETEGKRGYIEAEFATPLSSIPAHVESGLAYT